MIFKGGTDILDLKNEEAVNGDKLDQMEFENQKRNISEIGDNDEKEKPKIIKTQRCIRRQK